MNNRQNQAQKSSRRWLWLAAVAAVLGLAWFDGGEEPVHSITQEIALPEISG